MGGACYAFLNLRQIRDSRLYRAEHATFEDYCQKRWGMARRHANQLIESSGVVANLGAIAPMPEKETHVRPLTRLAPDRQREAWTKATERAASGHLKPRDKVPHRLS